MIPKRSYKLIACFENYSEALGKDVKNILTKACEPESKRSCSGHDVTEERLKDLLSYVEQFKQSIQLREFNQFIREGFNLLENTKKWAEIEQELYLIEQKNNFTKRGGSILSGILNLAKTHFDDQKLLSPSRVSSTLKVIDISKLYIYPLNWVIDFNILANRVLQKTNGHNKYSNSIHLVLKVLADIRNELVIEEHIADKKGVEEAFDNNAIFEAILLRTPKDQQSRLIKFRSAYNPHLHGKEAKFAGKSEYVLVAGKESRGAMWLYELSPSWFKQSQKYISHIYENQGQKAAISSITRLTKISSAIVDHKDHISNLKLLETDGISAFFSN